MKVIVASKNPVKINAVKEAFKDFYPKEDIEVIGLSVDSGVADQPMSDKETLRGATNRAKNLKEETDADFYIGIEGGIEKTDVPMAFAWVVTIHKEMIGKAKTSTFVFPDEIMKMIEEGMEMGHANDIYSNQTNSKQKGGMVSTLTKGLITRTSYYKEAVILSLI